MLLLPEKKLLARESVSWPRTWMAAGRNAAAHNSACKNSDNGPAMVAARTSRMDDVVVGGPIWRS